MAQTVTSIVSTGGLLLGRLAPALAYLATLDLAVQTVLPVQQATAAHLLMIALLIPAKPLLPLLMTGLMVTSTASMGEILVGLQDLAHALLATLGLMVLIVSSQHIMWST